MKEKEKIEAMKLLIEKASRNVHADGNAMEGVRVTLELVIRYIDFMLTPAELEDD